MGDIVEGRELLFVGGRLNGRKRFVKYDDHVLDLLIYVDPENFSPMVLKIIEGIDQSCVFRESYVLKTYVYEKLGCCEDIEWEIMCFYDDENVNIDQQRIDLDDMIISSFDSLFGVVSRKER